MAETPINLSNNMVPVKAPANPFTGALYSYADSANPMYVNPKGFDATANRAEKRIAASRKQIDQLIAIDPTNPLTVLLRIMGERKGQKIRADLDELRGVKAEKEAKIEHIKKAYENIQRSGQEKDFEIVVQESYGGDYTKAFDVPLRLLHQQMAEVRGRPPVLDIKDKLTITANLFRMEREIAAFEEGLGDMSAEQANLKRNMINEASVALGYKNLADFHKYNKAPVDPNKATLGSMVQDFPTGTSTGGVSGDLTLQNGKVVVPKGEKPTGDPTLVEGFKSLADKSELFENTRAYLNKDPNNQLFLTEAVEDMYLGYKNAEKFDRRNMVLNDDSTPRIFYNNDNNTYVKPLSNGDVEVGVLGGEVLKVFKWQVDRQKDTSMWGTYLNDTLDILFTEPRRYWGINEKALNWSSKWDAADPDKSMNAEEANNNAKKPLINVWAGYVDAALDKLSTEAEAGEPVLELKKKFPAGKSKNPTIDEKQADTSAPEIGNGVQEWVEKQKGFVVSTDGNLVIAKATDGNFFAFDNDGVSLVGARTEEEVREFVVAYKDMIAAKDRVSNTIEVNDEDAQEGIPTARTPTPIGGAGFAGSPGDVEGLRSMINADPNAELGDIREEQIPRRRPASSIHLKPATSAEIRLKDVIPEATTTEPGKQNFFVRMYQAAVERLDSTIVALNQKYPDLADTFPNVHPWFFQGRRNESTTQTLARLQNPPSTVEVLSAEKKDTLRRTRVQEENLRRTRVQEDIGAGDRSQLVTGGPFKYPKGYTPPPLLRDLPAEEYVTKVRKLDRALDALIFVENEPGDPYAIGFKLEKHRRSNGKLYHVLVDEIGSDDKPTGKKVKVPQAYGLAQLTIATARKMKTGKQHKHLSDDDFKNQVLFNKKKNIMIAKEYVNIIRERLRKNKYARKFKKHEFDALVAATYNTGEGIIKKINSSKPKNMDDLISKLQNKLERQTVTQIERFRKTIGDR